VKSVLGTWSKSRFAFLAIGIVFVVIGVVTIVQGR
jgi:hypothetical protein